MKARNLGLSILVAAALVAGLMGFPAAAFAQSPAMPHWVDPLPVPPVATPTFNPPYSLWADYYEINMSATSTSSTPTSARPPCGPTG